jgi:hypothetical protein
VGVEPTGDRIACRPPVLKTGTITGPHALPQRDDKKTLTGGTAANPTEPQPEPWRSLQPLADSPPRRILFDQLFGLSNDA